MVVGIVVLLVLRDQGDSDDGAKTAPPPLSCETLGDRALQCRRELLKEASEFVETASLAAGRSPVTAGGRSLLLTGALENAIRRGEVKTHCEAQRASPAPIFLRLWPELQRCWVKRRCAAFAACLRRVAEIEQAAGRIPL